MAGGKPGNPNWKKGVSGNPGGRPAGCAAWCQKQFGKNGEKLWQAFYAIATDPKANHTVRLDAYRELANRGFGKPTEQHEHTMPEGVIIRHVLERS